MLGYEVFNPPYLSSVIDQSAVIDWKPQIDSTLPKEVISILSKTNFFYDSISSEIGEILNQYFEVAIITIDPNWLKNFLLVYHGKVIYRVYGQPYALSNYLADNRILDLITERENFWFCPHNEEVLRIEDSWIKYLNTRIIPYCISDDVMKLKDLWRFQDINAPEYSMGLMCPRILDIPYYNYYYRLIKSYFSDNQFKIFGVQILPVSDPQVVGTLERKDFLAHLIKLKGFIYHYPEPATCYLPPIEFMTLGGPVVFLEGCLLSRYFKNLSAPGEARDLAALVKLAKKLKKGDYSLSNEIIHSQKDVRTLYHPDYVWPIFDKTMTEILTNQKVVPAIKLLYNINTIKKKNLNEKHSIKKSILIPFHRLGANIEIGPELSYYSVEGIVRVANLMVRVLTQRCTVIVTCHRRDFGKIFGFFSENINDLTKLKIFILEDTQENILLKKINNKAKLFSLKIILFNKVINKIIFFLKNPLIQNIILYFNFSIHLIHKINNTSYTKIINQDKSISSVIIPHYYLFPETCAIKKPILLYLPDYLPHFYKGSLEMGDHWSWCYIGKKLAKKATVIFTNSEFTRNYLPYSALRAQKEKIIYFPLAYLFQPPPKKANSFTKKLIKKLPDMFVFYPTRDRPSKRLDDFSEIVNILNGRLRAKGMKRRIYGVLTTKFTPKRQDNKYIISLPTLPDTVLTQVYQLASALVFTSENEGNFPTQINEALFLNTPVIATNIPQITNELGDTFTSLQLIEVGDCEKFADAILYTINNKEKVLSAQQAARKYAMKHFSYEQFSTNFIALFYKNFLTLTKENTH
ncbi:glycosyltransferase family 4 protein [Rickettsiella endosymbiont of Miltochrista miniata]|uniref:glycosyltransferase family 4 protein n=1 Tax=Rickettsiella endosymbiont of Miltochrista miniata TaxID=3066239 RepID=UPI00313F231F